MNASVRQLLLLLQLQPYLVLLHARVRAAKRTSIISNIIITSGGYNRCALAPRENGSGESLLCSLVCVFVCASVAVRKSYLTKSALARPLGDLVSVQHHTADGEEVARRRGLVPPTAGLGVTPSRIVGCSLSDGRVASIGWGVTGATIIQVCLGVMEVV